MQSKRKKKNELDKKIVKSIVEGVALSMFADGKLNKLQIKDRSKLLKEMLKYIPKNDEDFFFVITHQEGILKEASYYGKKKKHNFARIFYATYFEHEINDIISHACNNKKIHQKNIKTIIQSVNFVGKFTWLLELLSLPVFNQKHYNVIQKLTEKRNSFVHYKFIPVSANINNDDESGFLIEKGEIEKTIKYCKYYKSKILFNGNKLKILNVLRKGRR